MDINELELIPRWLGEPMYPGGFPLKAEDVKFKDKSVYEIYFQKSHSEIEETFLKNYMIYYLHAPIFDNELSQELKEKDLVNMSSEELWWELLNIGIDCL